MFNKIFDSFCTFLDLIDHTLRAAELARTGHSKQAKELMGQ